MNREREENDERTSQAPTSNLKLRCCHEITASEINIPLDLTVEILKKLPAKSLVRFQCVSKQWSTIIGSQKYFIDSIVTRSLAQPRCDDLHFIFHHLSPEPFFFFSSTYTYREHAGRITGARYHNGNPEYQYVRGLICCIASNDLVTIYNPTTRQSVSLPEIKSPHTHRNFFFGYDPIMNQYKVMSLANRLQKLEQVFQILTLGDPMKQWRNIEGIENHWPLIKGVHINGTTYYGAKPHVWSSNSVATFGDTVMFLSFDFRSEIFAHINAPKVVSVAYGLWHLTLVNYKGKLGCLMDNENNGIDLWVMEDAEQKEWSKTILYMPIEWCIRRPISAVTLGSKIFIFPRSYIPSETLYVDSYDLTQNSFRRIDIGGITERIDIGGITESNIFIVGVSDHVENTIRL